MATETFTTPGTFDWTAPPGVSSVQIQGWGAGGGGAGNSGGGTDPGGGGGGGGYIIGTLSVSPGTTYTGAIVVGLGGIAGAGQASSFTIDGSHYVSGGGGDGGLLTAGGAGGTADFAGATSTNGFFGGIGANGATGIGGGGGGSAGTAAGGNAGSGFAGGSAVTGGGAGGRGGDFSNASVAGSQPGGGGGGAGITGAGSTPSAGGAGKMVLTYTAAPDNAGFRSPTIVSTPSPPPFPGKVIRLVNPFGIPAPSVASGESAQYKAFAESAPPFPGQVISIRSSFGPTPSVPSGPTTSYRPIPETVPPFPGAVLRSLSSPFGLNPLPSRPVKVETASPPAFAGAVLTGRETAPEIRPPLVPAAIVRTPETPQGIVQPKGWAGVPPRDALTRPMVIAADPPSPFGGGVIVQRSSVGVPPLPSHASAIVAIITPSQEPGRVLALSGRATLAEVPVRPSVVVQSPSESVLVQTKMWSGTPPRDAAFKTGSVVGLREEAYEPGRVLVSRPSFGVSPIPSRPTVVRQEETPKEPGRVIYSRPVSAAPVLPPRSTVVWSESIQSPVAVHFRRGESAPNVTPRTYLIAGETKYPEVSQPFFGWGDRTGTGTATVLVPTVVLYGTDYGVVTLTSTDCEC